jgi:hypothetical protein
MIWLYSKYPTRIYFSSSTVSSDANTYTITISAKFLYQTAWLKSDTATYTYYIDPGCYSATITAVVHSPITTSVLVPASSLNPLWYVSVSGSTSSQYICGSFRVITKTYTIAPPSFVQATMDVDFNLSPASRMLSLNPTK